MPLSLLVLHSSPPLSTNTVISTEGGALAAVAEKPASLPIPLTNPGAVVRSSD